MCGIAGILRRNNHAVDYSELKKLTDSIVHRGPDGEGHWINEKQNVGFGHRRLSIIDLSDYGHQPMHYADGRYTITFNGEIYNYVELKRDLVKKGYSFVSQSDTEVLLALYTEFKEKCLQLLDGMFAFAIWDNKEETLFCARDRFGEKPFHYFSSDEQFVFASEIKQFWALGLKKEVDQAKLMRFVELGRVDHPDDLNKTYFKNISKLDAAHYLMIKPNGKIEITRYWDLSLEDRKCDLSLEEASEKFLELFTKSIKNRLRSDVPVGSCLSGGVDSSSIVMILDSIKDENVDFNTFSARFKDFKKDEGKHIEEVLKACSNVNPHNVWIEKDYFDEYFEKVTYHQDEPYGDSSIVAEYAVMQLAKKNGITVMFDGQGADEILAGYLVYYVDYLYQLYYNSRKKYNSELKYFNKFHRQGNPMDSFANTETMRMKMGMLKKKVFGQELPLQNNLWNSLKWSTTVNLKDLLRYADRNSMSHSVEVRLPFLNHELVEFMFSLPDHYKINQGWTKFILRNSMSSKLPDSICWRVDKIGYETPQKSWVDSPDYQDQIRQGVSHLSVDHSKCVERNLDWRILLASKFV